MNLIATFARKEVRTTMKGLRAAFQVTIGEKLAKERAIRIAEAEAEVTSATAAGVTVEEWREQCAISEIVCFIGFAIFVALLTYVCCNPELFASSPDYDYEDAPWWWNRYAR